MTAQPDVPKADHPFPSQAKSSTNFSGTNVSQLSRKFVARRISEGETGRLKEELKCQACGKGYKHVSSLAKHLWEHTPEWNVTSKLLISKHQQVQLLEAASILVSMNEEDEEDGVPVDDQSTTSPDGSVISGELTGSSEHELCTRESSSHKSAPHKAVAHEPEEIGVSIHHLSEARAIPIVSHIPQSIKDELGPARDIPILSSSSKSIAKQPLRSSHRRMSHSSSAFGGPASLGSNTLGSSVGNVLSSSLGGSESLETHLRQASPLPEHILLSRRRRPSTLFTNNGARDLEHDEEDDLDGLQDVPDTVETQISSQTIPGTPKQSPPPRKVSPKKEDVFGIEV